MSRKMPEVYRHQPITGTKKDPILIRSLARDNAKFMHALGIIAETGASMELRTRRRSDNAVVEAFDRVKNAVTEGQAGDIPLLTAKAIVETRGTLKRGRDIEDAQQEGLGTNLGKVYEGVKDMTTISVSREGSSSPEASSPEEAFKDQRIREAIDLVNTILQEDKRVQKYAVHRLTWDMQDSEKGNIWRTLKLAAVAMGAGFLLENWLAKLTTGFVRQVLRGLGLFAEGQTDDVATTVTTFQTEKGGGKSLGQMVGENKLTIGSMAVAGVAGDGIFLPQAFDRTAELGISEIKNPLPFGPQFDIHTPNLVAHTPIDGITHWGLYWPTIAGLTFAATAFAGSLTGKYSNIKRSAATIRALDKEGLLPGSNGEKNTVGWGKSWRMGFKENQTHPFRIGLLAGIGLSLGLSWGTAVAGILEGTGISPFIQGVIGPLETGVAYLALTPISEAIYSGGRNVLHNIQFAISGRNMRNN